MKHTFYIQYILSVCLAILKLIEEGPDRYAYTSEAEYRTAPADNSKCLRPIRKTKSFYCV
jgi:hypothetical protein